MKASFPMDRWTRVAESAVEGWEGTPLTDADGKVIGRITDSHVEDGGMTIVVEALFDEE